jgi:filamentous hemagglutinin
VLGGLGGDDEPSADSTAVGVSLIQSVVNYFGDEVVATGQRVTVPGLGSTDIDVELSDGSYIEVGGAAKAISPSAFGRQLQIVQAYAESQGGTAKFLYASGTPQSVIDQAIKRLGADNVGPIP